MTILKREDFKAPDAAVRRISWHRVGYPRHRFENRLFSWGLLSGLFYGLSAVLAAAGGPDSEPAPPPPPPRPVLPSSHCCGEPPPLDSKGPRFLNLRYDEDYGYLDDVDPAEKSDPWLKLKNVHLNDRWRADFGGEFRLRWESRTNERFGLEEKSHNDQQNYRWLFHVNLKYDRLFRVFAQGIVAHVEDQDGPFEPTQENHGDLQQLFFDLRFAGENAPWTLRVGRQEFAYGAYRLVGPLNWVSTRRRFDAVKMLYRDELWDVDAFYAKPVVVKRDSADDWNEEFDFYGLYSTYKGIPLHGWDFYFFGVDRTEDTVNPNGNIGDQAVYTLGTRFFGKPEPWDYDIEFSGQWGTWAGDRIEAWSAAIDAGYTVENWAMTPRFGGGFDWTSGDDDPEDGTVGTFNQLFPFDHVCVGILDLIGRQNLTRTYAAVDLWPVKNKVKFSSTLHVYWLSEEKDNLYNSGGVPILRDPKGRGGVEFGQELDLWLDWYITAYSTLSVGYSHFWDDNYVHSVVDGDDDPDLFLVQYRYRF